MNDTSARALGFTANSLIRLAEERSEETLGVALVREDARILVVSGGRFLCRGDPERPEPLFTLEQATGFGADLAQAVLLGWTADRTAPRLAVALGLAEDEAPAGTHLADLRTMGMNALLSPDLEGQLAQALHLLNWHRRTRFCGSCGGPTVSEIAGYRRRCTLCGESHFPRTDPVVIMLVHDRAGRCLFGRQRHFAPGMWSCLAGFVEPGETIEDAVRRETREEAGIAVGTVAYRTSQPWPFPNSMMIGCFAEALSEALTIQDSELEDVRWFDRDEVRAMLARTHPEGLTMPPAYAIATRLAQLFCDDA